MLVLGWSTCQSQPSSSSENQAGELVHPVSVSADPPPGYAWLSRSDPANSIANRIAVPTGCRRIAVESGSFEHWLRHLPLKPGRPAVHLFDGRQKANQNAHAAVIDIDVGNRDLQQCADAVIRLRAEYLFAKGQFDAIRFNATSGDPMPWSRWVGGERPRVSADRIEWKPSSRKDHSHANFRLYLDSVFAYAGTYSLRREMHPFDRGEDLMVGDVFIQGGFPGHAVIVVDMAVDETSGRKYFLLAQSYMPAQEIHVLKNPNRPVQSPWYDAQFGGSLITPEWIFERSDLRRFK